MLTALTCLLRELHHTVKGAFQGQARRTIDVVFTGLSGNLPCNYGTSMDREDCGKPWTAELSDDIQDTSIVGGLTNQPAQIRCMKLPVGAWCGADLIMELLHCGIFFLRRFRPCRGPQS